MAINAEWHGQNVMPKNPSQEQRLAWHLAHQESCGCRPMPPQLEALVRAKREDEKTALRELLVGQDRRSVAGASAVLKAVLAQPDRISEVAGLVEDSDWLVSMRALDVLEKLAQVHPGWVQPFRRRLIGPAADSEQWEVRLQIVRALPLLSWSSSERRRVVEILVRDVEHPQKFLRAWALDALATFASTDATLMPKVKAALRALERTKSKALLARARRIKARLRQNEAKGQTSSAR